MGSDDQGGGGGGDEEFVRRLSEEPGTSPLWAVFRQRYFTVVGRALHGLILAPGPLRGPGSGFAVMGPVDQHRLRCSEELRTEIVVDALIRGLDTFTRNLRREKGWRPGGATLENYLVRGGLHALADCSRQRRRARELAAAHLVDDDPLEVPAPVDAGPEDQVVTADYVAAVVELLRTKDELVLEAFVLHAKTGETYDRIAAHLGVAPSTLWRRLRAARDYLRDVLEERGEGDGRIV